VPEPALVTKKRMLSGAFGAFCARVAENPSDRSAIEAKRDSVFIGDFMIDLSLGLVRARASRTLSAHPEYSIPLDSPLTSRPADRRTSSSMTRVSCIPLDYKNKSPRRGF
jgi:hypothetical protein